MSSTETCPTVKIKSNGDIFEINEKDFDPKKHELYEEGDKAGKSAGGTPAPLSDTAQKLVDDNGLDVTKIVGTGTDGSITVKDVKAAVAAKKAALENASPDAVKFAEEAGFDLSGVKGTGKGGMITVEDVQDAIEAAEESEA